MILFTLIPKKDTSWQPREKQYGWRNKSVRLYSQNTQATWTRSLWNSLQGFNEDHNPVAIKQVSKSDRRRASAEAVKSHYLKQNVSGEHIIGVYDVKTWEDSIWIMMEFCDLGDLNNYFENYHQNLDAKEKG